MDNKITINGVNIGKAYPPFIIAEMSGNHNQSLDRALKIVDAAARAGAHAVKIQTYTADTMTLDIDEGEFHIDDEKSPWRGASLYKLYRQAYTPWEWHEVIFKRCSERGLICFSTPFDETAVDFLESLDAPCYKIASFENVHLPLIRRAARTGKPLIISTGMASISDLHEAVQTAREQGCKDLTLLKCTSSYPSSPEGSNIATIPHMRELFNCEVGLSDHSLGIGVAVAAVALGATVVEKHFTLSRADGGVDAAFSMEPDEMQSLVKETERAWQSLGKITYGISEQEKNCMMFRRSLYITQDMKAGDVFTKDNLRIVRPGFGLAPRHYDALIGMKAAMDIKKGTPASWDLVR